MMRTLGGIIHPLSFQTNELVLSMSQAFDLVPRDLYRHKNIELAQFGAAIFPSTPPLPVVLIDGKIHNSESVREKLAPFGFHPQGDADLIAHAYHVWQEDFLLHCEGDFVIALFDRQKEMLYLIRDRLGKKTLYWTTEGGYFLFSTGLKGLLATGVVPQTPSLPGLSSYLYFGYIPQDLTPVLGVNKLLPGYFLKVDLKGKFSIEQYWSLSLLMEKKENKDEGEFEKILEEAVLHTLPAHKQVSLLPSFGQGYGMIEHCLKNRDDVTLSTYSPELLEPEEALSDLVNMVWHLDEPVAHLSSLNIWQAGKRAMGQTETLFVDVGWDEMIATSFKETHTSFPLAYHLARLPKGVREYGVMPFLSLFLPNFKWRILRNLEINRGLMDYLSAISLFKGGTRKAVAPHLYSHFDPEVFIERFHRLSKVAPGHDMIFYFNAKTVVPDCLLLQYEKLMGAFGIEVQTPYLEERVLEFAAKVPMHVRGQKAPVDLLQGSWCHSPYFRELFGLLGEGVLVQQQLICPKWIRHHLGYPHLVPRIFKKFWALLILEIWFRLYINEPIGKATVTLTVDELLRS